MSESTVMRPYRYRGMVIAGTIIAMWFAHLVWCLTEVSLTGWSMPVHVAIQAFLNVGLFITAHDAMHRSLAPRDKALNDKFGALALFLYGGFLYDDLKRAHFRHHAAPVSDTDPDYTRDGQERFWPWLKDFVFGYYSWKNFALMHIHIIAFWLIAGSPWPVLVFFAVPAWLSALQLFVFGTYLPHRTQGGHEDRHNARSNDYPEWLSFLTCYHFGYHREHHHHPRVPWWRLPKARKRMLAAEQAAAGPYRH